MLQASKGSLQKGYAEPPRRYEGWFVIEGEFVDFLSGTGPARIRTENQGIMSPLL